MISDIDISDWDRQPLTPLYEVPRNTYCQTEEGFTFYFAHIDGLYSLCYDVTNNSPLHFMASMKVYPLKET